ncbi:cyanophycinase [Altererythrobacter sp. BO-6]|uniref:cyanophycinase n=1 Tax=Altererythrobacter sp. BO-6 TaxID=2604537 RepID=UPI0013E113E3|nr:cyanophycinase [Altererythrobacter sp. BO-6]QIG53644.1 cyanophycinase [Altererythrobacter sp. BO-6]
MASIAHADSGTLVIVGGGLQPDNAEVFTAFLDARPDGTPKFVIIPAASGEPQQSADAFRETLIAHGVDPAAILLVELAMVDDPSTESVDEASWRDNSHNPVEIAKIEQAGAIWFTGGDQSRISALLIASDGHDSPMLASIRARLEAGAVIGGTSAGAAIMSDPMITQGDTLAALAPQVPGESLEFGRGLGFAGDVLIDQHFGQRARLGRLAAALTDRRQALKIGMGIDEDTALLVDRAAHTARVVGTGYVTILDARFAHRNAEGRPAINGLMVGLGASGDTIDLANASIAPAPFKRPTLGREYFDAATPSGGGMALAGQSLAEVAGEGLLDNSAAQQVVRHSFVGEFGVTYRFTQTEVSHGWWGRGPNGTARYTLSGIGFDIEPIEVTIKRAGN